MLKFQTVKSSGLCTALNGAVQRGCSKPSTTFKHNTRHYTTSRTERLCLRSSSNPRRNNFAAGRWGQHLRITQAQRSFIPGIDLNNDEDDSGKKDDDPGRSRTREILIKCLETAGITLASLSMLALAGYGYQEMYQTRAVKKIEDAFKEGDPSFTLSLHSNRTSEIEGW